MEDFEAKVVVALVLAVMLLGAVGVAVASRGGRPWAYADRFKTKVVEAAGRRGGGAVRPDEFAGLMRRELEANACKGDWTAWKPSRYDALEELHRHVKKLDAALWNRETVRVLEHAADVANICMKIVEREGEGWNDGTKALGPVPDSMARGRRPRVEGIRARER